MRVHVIRVLSLVAVCAVVLPSCSKDEPPRRKDTVARAESLPGGAAAPTDLLAVVWDTAAGPYFALPGATPGEAQLVYPLYSETQNLDTLRVDTTRIQRVEFDLLQAGDSVFRARAVAFEPDSVDACASWPSLRIDHAGVPQDAPGSAALRPWTVAFPPGRARIVATDSLPELARADSGRLTIAIARAASKVPGDTAAAFRGRPFVVRQANRFRLDDRDVVLAEVARVVTQEANPLQEQLLLVLEAESEMERAPLLVAFAVRSIGLEEALASVELVSALRFRDTRYALLLQREVGDGSRLELLERASPGQWIVRWRSAYAGC